jgi:hypothetical protein
MYTVGLDLRKFSSCCVFWSWDAFIAPMKMYCVPEGVLTSTINNFGRSTNYRSLYREAFVDNTLKLVSHEESYMIEVSAN